MQKIISIIVVYIFIFTNDIFGIGINSIFINKEKNNFYKNEFVLMSEAFQYFQKERYGEAAKIYFKITSKNPDYNEGVIKLIEASYFAKAYEQVLRYCNYYIKFKIINDDNFLSQCYFFQANVLRKQKKDKDALRDYDKGIELNKYNTDAYNNRGLTYFALKQYGKAIADYKKAIELNSGYVQSYNNLGLVYYEQKIYTLAEQNYSNAILFDPNFAQAYLNRAFLYMIQAKYDLAEQDYKIYFSLNPKDEESYYYRIYSYFLAKRKELKKQNSSIKYIPLEHNNINLLSSIADICKKFNKYHEVVDLYTKIISLNPDNKRLKLFYYERASVYLKIKKYQNALDDYLWIKEKDFKFKDICEKIKETKEKLKIEDKKLLLQEIKDKEIKNKKFDGKVLEDLKALAKHRFKTFRNLKESHAKQEKDWLEWAQKNYEKQIKVLLQKAENLFKEEKYSEVKSKYFEILYLFNTCKEYLNNNFCIDKKEKYI